jgi:hypothetical protein
MFFLFVFVRVVRGRKLISLGGTMFLTKDTKVIAAVMLGRVLLPNS